MNPPECNRPPRSLDLSFWKASTFREWVMHCSVPCCEGIVDDARLKSWAAFVRAFLLLSSDAIHPVSHINEARRMISLFLSTFQAFYGK